MTKKLSWMDEELKAVIIEVLDPTVKQKNKDEVLDVISDLIIKRYKENIKSYKEDRNKWMDDNFEENSKILKQQERDGSYR